MELLKNPIPSGQAVSGKPKTAIENLIPYLNSKTVRSEWCCNPSLDCDAIQAEYQKLSEILGPKKIQNSRFWSAQRAAKILSCYVNIYELRISEVVARDTSRGLKVSLLAIDAWNDIINNIPRTFAFYMHLDSNDILEKTLKYLSAHLWAHSMEQSELPPAPQMPSTSLLAEFRYLVSGKGLASLMRHLQRHRLRHRFLIPLSKDLYAAKAGSAQVSSGFINTALEKHEAILCTPKDEEEITDELIEIAQEIRLVVREVFGPPSKIERQPPSRIPSLGASFANSRGNGGALGELFPLTQEEPEELEFSLPLPIGGYFFGFAVYNHSMVEVRTPMDPSFWYEYERQSRVRAWGLDKIKAKVIPLVEPFKVRTITTGDADAYHLARRWQKVIHAKLRRHPSFALIGQPCSSAFLSQIFSKEIGGREILNKLGLLISGDYESATDLIKKYLSEVTNGAICESLGIPFEDTQVLHKCLSEHLLHYYAGGGKFRSFEQQDGQLMGSPASFPILCIINFAVTALCYKRRFAKEFTRYSDLPIAVNGDDVVFWAPDTRFYESWKSLTAAAGLKFSLGKNYTSNRYIVINSELYTRTEPLAKTGKSSCSLLFEKVPCINTRLIVGGSRSAVGTAFEADPADWELEDQSARFARMRPPKREIGPVDPLRASVFDEYSRWRQTIGARQQKLHEQFLGDKQRRSTAYDEIIKGIQRFFNRIQLKKLRDYAGFEQPNTSFYLPPEMGGLGLVKVDGPLSPLDYGMYLACKELPQVAHDYARDRRLRSLPSPFMRTVSNYNRELSDRLGIPFTLAPFGEVEELRFGEDDESLWSLPYLSGFLNQVPQADSEELEEAKRIWKRQKKTPKSLLTYQHQRVNKWEREGADVRFLDQTILPVDWSLRKWRPSPRFA